MFLSQVIFIFLLFQLHQYTFLYPKTKEKQKLPGIKKLTIDNLIIIKSITLSPHWKRKKSSFIWPCY